MSAESDRLAFTRHDLFATPILLFDVSRPDMNDRLRAYFESHPRFSRDDQAQTADQNDLVALAAAEEPAFTELDAIFLDGLGTYCEEIGWRGEFDLDYQLFPNVAPKGHYVPSHNHVSHISAVYYVHAEPSDRPTLVRDESVSEYWRPEEGALILHDPRFNASLCGGWHQHAKVFPRPGTMIFFPSYLWHEVTPHSSERTRLSVAANLFQTFRDVPPYQRHQTFRV